MADSKFHVTIYTADGASHQKVVSEKDVRFYEELPFTQSNVKRTDVTEIDGK